MHCGLHVEVHSAVRKNGIDISATTIRIYFEKFKKFISNSWKEQNFSSTKQDFSSKKFQTEFAYNSNNMSYTIGVIQLLFMIQMYLKKQVD